MKALLAVQHYFPRYIGGVEQISRHVAAHLVARGHSVEIACLEPHTDIALGHTYETVDVVDGVSVRRLNCDVGFASANGHAEADQDALETWFASCIERAAPDVILVMSGYLLGPAPVLAAARAGIPSVLHLYDYWYVCPRTTLTRGDGTACHQVPDQPSACAWCVKTASRRYRFADRASLGVAGSLAQRLGLRDETRWMSHRRERLRDALKLPRRVVVPALSVAERFDGLVTQEQLRLVRFGVEVARFATAREPRPNNAIRLAYFGQFTPHKAPHTLIEAFKRLRSNGVELTLTLRGYPTIADYVARLRAMSADDPRIHVGDAYSADNMPSLLSRSDLVVVPSEGYEGGPIVAVEVRAAGVPVVGSRLGSIPEFVRDGVDGVLFAPGDARDLARVLQSFVDEPRRLDELAQSVRRNPPNDLAQEMAELTAIYSDAAAKT